MRRVVALFVIALIAVPLVWLASGHSIPGLSRSEIRIKAQSVPAGDVEFAWLHTTTNGSTWERFVAGFLRATRDRTDLSVDDSLAFPDDTTSVPEFTVRLAGRPGRILVRWYKTGNDASHADWIRALATRNPAPLAVIGGGSSDRAKDLALAMNARLQWQGDRPLLFLTTASAESLDTPMGDDETASKRLMDVYDNRTLRFCFSNRQMADATVEWIWTQPDLIPGRRSDAGLPALAGGAAILFAERPRVLFLQWQDDPYSLDLREQFRIAVFRHAKDRGQSVEIVNTTPIPFSVGGFFEPNRYERAAVDFVVREIEANPDRRSLLVLPTVTASARRIVRTICGLIPDAADRLVVVNGDGIPMNAVYRDGEWLWPPDRLSVPLVLFAHANPVGWDDDLSRFRIGLQPPTSTEDVLLFADLATIVCPAALPAPGSPMNESLIERIHRENPDRFDHDGNRVQASGEFAIVLRPGRNRLPARIDVWQHRRSWDPVRSLTLPARTDRAGMTP